MFSSSESFSESFSEESLQKFEELLAEVQNFQRCERKDGSFYGTSGQCRKGSPAGDKEKSAPTDTRKGSPAGDKEKSAPTDTSKEEQVKLGKKVYKEDKIDNLADTVSSRLNKKQLVEFVRVISESNTVKTTENMISALASSLAQEIPLTDDGVGQKLREEVESKLQEVFKVARKGMDLWNTLE